MLRKPAPAKSSKSPDGGFKVGYARVSTEEQNLEMQLSALVKAGVLADNIHTDKCSAAKKNRPGLENALKDCREGDTLVFWRLDRLGRNLVHIIMLVDELAARGVNIHSITEGFDTTTPAGRFMLHMIAAMAEFERSLIALRTKAGIARIIEEEGGFNRKFNRDDAAELFKQGKSGVEVARAMGVTKGAIYNVFDQGLRDSLKEEGARKRKRK